MSKQYHIEPEKYTLMKFKESLARRKMIPSRTILKEELEKRFTLLQKAGIENLKDLLGLLKSKPNVEEFSKRTGLSVEYLTVLKREAGSYFPNPVALKKFPGLDSKVVSALEGQGIKNSRQLFEKAEDEQVVKLLAEECGIRIDHLKEVLALSDLSRLYGVGPHFARIIYNAEIYSTKEFLKYSAIEIIKKYETATGKKADFTESDINFSLELGRELD